MPRGPSGRRQGRSTEVPTPRLQLWIASLPRIASRLIELSLGAEYLQHEHGTGHGPTISQPPGGFGSVSVPDNHRVVHHSNAPPPEAEVKLDGPASQTKDWRTEGSRIGRYWANDKFQVQPNGTWNFEK